MHRIAAVSEEGVEGVALEVGETEVRDLAAVT